MRIDWTPDLDAQALRLWREGGTVEAIALEIKLSHPAVGSRLRRLLGVVTLPRRVSPASSWCEREDQMLLELWSDGASMQVMAARLRRGQQGVSDRLKRLLNIPAGDRLPNRRAGDLSKAAGVPDPCNPHRTRGRPSEDRGETWGSD